MSEGDFPSSRNAQHRDNVVTVPTPTASISTLLAQIVNLLPLTGQLSPEILRIIERGGSTAIIVCLLAVVIYREKVTFADLNKQIADLHGVIHERDKTLAATIKAHADAVSAMMVTHSATVHALHVSHAADAAKVTEERIDEMEAFATKVASIDRSVATLDSVARSLETFRGKK